MHHVGVVLTGKDVAGSSHVGSKLINFVKPPIDHLPHEIWIAKIPMTKSSASVSLKRGNLRSVPRTQKPSRFKRRTR